MHSNIKKVFVSGCFDVFHSGHVAFLAEAAKLGDVYAAVGSDATVEKLKGVKPKNPEGERLMMVRSCRYVREAFIAQGEGYVDFKKDFLIIKPDILFVNEDGDRTGKRSLCEFNGVEYVVAKRRPFDYLPVRSSTSVKESGVCGMPYRIDLCGGWLDQPSISSIYPGGVITVSIEPQNFNERSGMASSTRRKAIDLWGDHVPEGTEREAKILFEHDNPPGTKTVSGSQDAIGIIMPGVNFSHYNGEYWPHYIDTLRDTETMDWLENVLHLVPIRPRPDGFDVYAGSNRSKDTIHNLSRASWTCMSAIIAKDTKMLGWAITECFTAQIGLFPAMLDDYCVKVLESIPKESVLGHKLTGAGGGGYWLIVSEKSIDGSIRVKLRR